MIVQCHGCFDIVHPGHIRYLQFASTQGDLLIVSITGDEQVGKGAQRPYIPQELRAENLAALSFVDYVVIDPHPTAAKILSSVRPDVYVKGREYSSSDDPRFLAERKIVEDYGGRVVFSSGEVVFSSSRIVESMNEDAHIERARLSAVCRRHDLTATLLHEAISRFAGLRVLVAGDVVVERYIHCESAGMSTESPMMSVRELNRLDFVGGAGAVALQIAALGATPVLATALADDTASRFVRETLIRGGVEISDIDAREETPVHSRYLVDEQRVFKLSSGRPSPMETARERAAAGRLVAAARGADACIVLDGSYGLLSPGVLGAINGVIRERVPFISVGASEAQPAAAGVGGGDLICCSERRLRAGLQDREGSLSTLAYRLLEKSGARRMIVTVGKRGVVTFDRPSQDADSTAWRGRLLSEYLPSFAGSVQDPFGAGESLLATASLGLATGCNLMQAAYLANLVAGATVMHEGPQSIGTDEVCRHLEKRHELRSEREQTGTHFGAKIDASFSHRTPGWCDRAEQVVGLKSELVG